MSTLPVMTYRAAVVTYVSQASNTGLMSAGCILPVPLHGDVSVELGGFQVEGVDSRL